MRLKSSLGVVCAAVVFIIHVISTAAYAQPIVIALPDTTVRPGDTLLLPIRIHELLPSDSVYSFQIGVRFSAEGLTLTNRVTRGPLFQGGMLNAGVQAQTNTVSIVGSSVTAITGSGTLVYLEVGVEETAPDSTHATAEIVRAVGLDRDIFLNEGWTSAPRWVDSISGGDTTQVWWSGILLREIELRHGSILITDSVSDPNSQRPQLTASPNPFYETIELRISNTGSGVWQGVIVSLTGQVVRHWEISGADTSWTWDGRDHAGRPVASGIYVAYARNINDSVQTRVTLLR